MPLKTFILYDIYLENSQYFFFEKNNLSKLKCVFKKIRLKREKEMRKRERKKSQTERERER